MKRTAAPLAPASDQPARPTIPPIDRTPTGRLPHAVKAAGR